MTAVAVYARCGCGPSRLWCSRNHECAGRTIQPGGVPSARGLGRRSRPVLAGDTKLRNGGVFYSARIKSSFDRGWPFLLPIENEFRGGALMKARKYCTFLAVGLVLFALVMIFPSRKASARGTESQFVIASSMLSGLAPGAVFPFIDTTPQTISQAHIAITDATTNCSPGAASPSNVKVLVGQAGVSLVSVMDASTDTGISTTRGQCVFHVTIHAGHGGVPSIVTDIVVLNAGSSPLTGINTVTASATVRVDESASN